MRKSSRRRFQALAVMWLSATPLSCARPAPVDRSPARSLPLEADRPTATNRLAASLDAHFTSQFPADAPGSAVLVMKRDRVVFSRGYGLADLETHEPVSTRTLFNLGSISKTFVANAILILQEQGKLSVEDDLSTYFPGFKHKDIASRVQLKHLLTHSSGLPDNREVAKNPKFYLTAKDAENWFPVTQADALVFEPGSRFAYSNPAFNGLALIVERVSGMKWQDFIHDKIFVPAGMTTSTITDGSHPETGVAHGYDKETGSWLEADYGEVPTFAASGNGGVWSSVEELARYEQALRKCVFLSPATIKDSRAVKAFANWTDPAPPSIGWSWFIRESSDEPRMVGHTGSQGGFVANYATYPDKDVFFVILANAPHDVKALTKPVVDALKQVSWLD